MADKTMPQRIWAWFGCEDARGGGAMKRVLYLSHWVEIPDEARWLATDNDGFVYAYDSFPEAGGTFWLADDDSWPIKFPRADRCHAWRSSLRYVEDMETCS